MRRFAPPLICAALALALAGAGFSTRGYRNEAMHVRGFEPPAGWVQAPQGSYPRLLTSYTHREGGRLTLAAQRVAPGTTALKLAESSRAALERQGFAQVQIASDGARARLTATLDGGKRIARQLYAVDSDHGYVVTLIAPATVETAMLHDYEEALRTLQIGTPADTR
jgi:hypothetical protein